MAGSARKPARSDWLLHRARASSARGRSRPRAFLPVPGGVGERLLQDAVRRLVERGRKRPPCSTFADADGDARRAVTRSKRLHGREPGRRLDWPPLSSRGSSSRRAATSWSISPSVSAPPPRSSPVPRGSGSRSCSSSSLAAPAWTRITLIACPAESCRSRAMRVRSSAAARRRSRSASLSARGARVLELGDPGTPLGTRSPITHAPPPTRAPKGAGRSELVIRETTAPAWMTCRSRSRRELSATSVRASARGSGRGSRERPSGRVAGPVDSRGRSAPRSPQQSGRDGERRPAPATSGSDARAASSTPSESSSRASAPESARGEQRERGGEHDRGDPGVEQELATPCRAARSDLKGC